MPLIKPRIIDVLLISYALLILVALRSFLRFDATFLLGIILLPTLFLVSEKRINYSIFWLLPFLMLAFLTPSYTLLYLAIIGALIGLYSHQFGKLSALPALLFMTISPVFNYVTDVFSFDLRLKITAFAVEILKKITPSVPQSNFDKKDILPEIQALGNVIRLKNGDEWQIDTACMGLNMLGMGLILAYFFIGFFSKKIGKLPTNKGILIFIMVALCFNLFSNLTRIIAVVLLNIPPETIGHELIGLLSFLIYSVMPIYFLIKWRINSPFYFKEKINNKAFLNPINELKKRDLIIQIGLLILFASRAIYLDFHKKMPVNLEFPTAITAHFKVHNLPDGVTQLKNDSILIYIKNLSNGFTTEHSPMICWKGSGYAFKQIERTTIGKTPIYIGILQRDTDQIHATWWFESDNFATNDQIEWRYRAFTEGSLFRLVNVNADSRERVLAAAREWLEKKKVN